EYDIATLEVERGERLREGDGRVLDDCDVPWCRADEAGNVGVCPLDFRLRGIHRLVAAELHFACNVAGDRIDDRLRHERRPRVVQVNATGEWCGRVHAPACWIEGHE